MKQKLVIPEKLKPWLKTELVERDGDTSDCWDDRIVRLGWVKDIPRPEYYDKALCFLALVRDMQVSEMKNFTNTLIYYSPVFTKDEIISLSKDTGISVDKIQKIFSCFCQETELLEVKTDKWNKNYILAKRLLEDGFERGNITFKHNNSPTILTHNQCEELAKETRCTLKEILIYFESILI